MNNWDHLRLFALVAEQGSVAASARQLGISHATILRSLQRLEDELGIRLFDHLRTGYRLTPEGAELLPHARAMAKEAEALARRAKGQGEIPAGELGIAIPDPSLVNLLPVIADFRTMYPNVEVNLRAGPAQLPGDLLDRDIRLVFMLTNTPPEDLVGRRLGTIEFRLAAAGSEYDCWIDWTHRSRLVDDDAFDSLRSSVDTAHSMIVGSHSEAASAVRAGIGVSALTTGTINGPADLVAIGQRHIALGLWMLTHTEFRGDGRVRALMAYCSSRFDASRVDNPH